MNILFKRKNIHLLVVLLAGVMILGCKKADVKVEKRDNKVEFIIQKNTMNNLDLSVGYTTANNSIEYRDVGMYYSSLGTVVLPECTLSRGREYLFTVTTDDYYPLAGFTIQMKVNDELYKEIVVSNPKELTTYTISGILETTRK